MAFLIAFLIYYTLNSWDEVEDRVSYVKIMAFIISK